MKSLFVIAFAALVSGQSNTTWAQQNNISCVCSGGRCTAGNLTFQTDGICTPIPAGATTTSCTLKTGSVSNTIPCIVQNEVKTGGAGATAERDITVVNKNGYGGAYNTANVTTTNAINDTVKVVNAGFQQVGQGMTNNAGAKAQADLMNSGTAQAAAQGTADTLNAQAKAQSMSGMVDMASGMTQLYRANAHRTSASSIQSKVDTAHQENVTKYNAAKAKCQMQYGGTFSLAQQMTDACEKEAKTAYDMTETNITNNALAEKAIQTQTAQNEAITAAGSVMNGVSAMQQAALSRDAAKAALAGANGSGFSFNPGTGSGYTDGGSATDPTAAAGAVVDSTGPTDSLAGNNQVNPGLDPSSPNGLDGRLGAGAPAAPAGPTGNSGIQSAGATTAGKDDSAKQDNTPPGKQSAGSYGDANGAPAGFNRVAGGPSVGLDNGFADMLKKFLPGGDEEKKKDGDLSFGDRMPASDAAAVIPRNKNIFEEVTKRYKKKTTEGAVVFSI